MSQCQKSPSAQVALSVTLSASGAGGPLPGPVTRTTPSPEIVEVSPGRGSPWLVPEADPTHRRPGGRSHISLDRLHDDGLGRSVGHLEIGVELVQDPELRESTQAAKPSHDGEDVVSTGRAMGLDGAATIRDGEETL